MVWDCGGDHQDVQRDCDVQHTTAESSRTHACSTFRACHRDLIRYLGRWVNCLSDAEDIAQEAFLRLIVSAAIDSEAHAKAFLFHVARNLATDELRKRSFRSRTDMIEAAARLTNTTAQSPEDFWQVRGRLEVLGDSVSKLPNRCRQVFALHKFEGLSHKDIASRLDISINAVEAHIVRALVLCRAADRQYLAADLAPRSRRN